MLYRVRARSIVWVESGLQRGVDLWPRVDPKGSASVRHYGVVHPLSPGFPKQRLDGKTPKSLH